MFMPKGGWMTLKDGRKVMSLTSEARYTDIELPDDLYVIRIPSGRQLVTLSGNVLIETVWDATSYQTRVEGKTKFYKDVKELIQSRSDEQATPNKNTLEPFEFDVLYERFKQEYTPLSVDGNATATIPIYKVDDFMRRILQHPKGWVCESRDVKVDVLTVAIFGKEDFYVILPNALNYLYPPDEI